MGKLIKYFFVIILLVQVIKMKGQSSSELNGRLAEERNILEYSVSFLTIAPDSRSGGMGDVGAATEPDVNSIHWNPAKYAVIKGDGGVGITYTPWLRNLVNDINLLYLSGFYRVDPKQVIAGSLLYFSLGDIIFTDEFGDYQGQHIPNEFAIDASYSRILTEYLSMGAAFRFIRSDLTGGGYINGTESKAGTSFAADYSMYYQRDIEIDRKESELAFGLNISNMGNKISYAVDNKKDEFIPTNLRLGSRLTTNIDEYNKISLSVDLNKTLVPTTPYIDSAGNMIGKDPDVGVAEGMFQSFYDAPGGFREEMHEIMFSIGTEYWYSNQFAIRAGYFNEHETKGGRKYLTLGIGLKLNVLSMDFAYLIQANQGTNPLANTMRFTLLFEFNKFTGKK